MRNPRRSKPGGFNVKARILLLTILVSCQQDDGMHGQALTLTDRFDMMMNNEEGIKACLKHMACLDEQPYYDSSFSSDMPTCLAMMTFYLKGFSSIKCIANARSCAEVKSCPSLLPEPCTNSCSGTILTVKCDGESKTIDCAQFGASCSPQEKGCTFWVEGDCPVGPEQNNHCVDGNKWVYCRTEAGRNLYYMVYCGDRLTCRENGVPDCVGDECPTGIESYGTPPCENDKLVVCTSIGLLATFDCKAMGLASCNPQLGRCEFPDSPPVR